MTSRFRRVSALALGLLCALALGACLPATPEALVLSTDTPASSPTPTATIVWFPATSTATRLPFPTRQSTPEQRPAVGQEVLRDAMSPSSLWPTLTNSTGTVGFDAQELSIAVSQPKSLLSTLRQGPELGDFYLEITTKANLCRDTDAYGLLLRAATPLDAYRLLIACNGLLRVERLNAGRVALLLDWTPSGQVPAGSPLNLRLGVWAYGPELRFFVNDIYQFSVRDPVFKTGKVGLFARSAGDTPLTISFSDLVVRQIVAADVPLPTLTPSITPTLPVTVRQTLTARP